MARRAVASRVVLGAAAALAVLGLYAPLDAASPPARAQIAVRLATVAGLPHGARTALTAEVERIWRRAGVAIHWLDVTATHAGAERDTVTAVEPVLRVLVVSRHRGDAADQHRWPVAELLGSAAPAPTAVASLDAAWVVLDAARHRGEPDARQHQRLGQVLGRAVAHEIGHYLLGRGHAPRGLMRARINAADFADLRDGGFELERGDAAAAVTAATQRPVRLAVLAPPR